MKSLGNIFPHVHNQFDIHNYLESLLVAAKYNYTVGWQTLVKVFLMTDI